MIHFTCDGCHRSLEPDRDARYVVRVEVYTALDAAAADSDDDRDHLEELQEIIERLDDEALEHIAEETYQEVRYDLCSECRRKFLRNPLGRGLAPQLNFSQN
jgi:hypothetical protein